MRSWLGFRFFLFASVALAPPAHADDARPPAYEPPAQQWYGYQTLVTDAASVALFSLQRTPLAGRAAGASLGMYGLGAPIVHFAHGHIGKGFADLGLRVALPVAGAFLGGIAGSIVGASGNEGKDGLGSASPGFAGVLIGGLAGLAGASAVDAAVLSYEPQSIDHDIRGSAPPRTWAEVAQPSFSVVPDHGGTAVRLGLTGSF